MTRVFRISKGLDVGEILDSIEALPEFAREHGPGQYDVDDVVAALRVVKEIGIHLNARTMSMVEKALAILADSSE